MNILALEKITQRIIQGQCKKIFQKLMKIQHEDLKQNHQREYNLMQNSNLRKGSKKTSNNRVHALTLENGSTFSIGKFSLLHSILWKTMRTCFAFLGLSSSFDASQTQLAATLYSGMKRNKSIINKLIN